MKRYTASVVGGGAGGRLSLNALQSSDRFDVLAVADIGQSAREALGKDYPGISVFDSHEAMFRESPTDVVCVSTWAPSHRAVTEAALRLPHEGNPGREASGRHDCRRGGDIGDDQGAVAAHGHSA